MQNSSGHIRGLPIGLVSISGLGVSHLTYRTPDVESAKRDRPAAEGRDASEIEVTPEMIEAGVVAWIDSAREFATERDTVSNIFKAMFGNYALDVGGFDVTLDMIQAGVEKYLEYDPGSEEPTCL